MSISHQETAEERQQRITRANILLALLLGGVVLLALFSTFYFWPEPRIPS